MITPRPYDLGTPEERKRLFRETGGYLKVCRRCGGDFDGRRYAREALQQLADQMPFANPTPTQSGFPASKVQVTFEVNFWFLVHVVMDMVYDGRPITRDSVENTTLSSLHERGQGAYTDPHEFENEKEDDLYEKAIEIVREMFPEYRRKSVPSEKAEAP